ncbi:MAG TPA: polyphosphate kinase 1 [Bacteroidetes bacterium]|nr:polyphosphate kinase 1 [Bacteroidota bacterium]
MIDFKKNRTKLNPTPKKNSRTQPSKNRKVLPYIHKGASTVDPSLFINRELSWLEFNHRVLEEALDQRHPLLERVKFLSIVSSNLDEFFMIRVAAIREQIIADYVEYSPDGLVPLQQIKAIHERVSSMVKQMSACFWKDLHPKLSNAGICLLKIDELKSEDKSKLADLFARKIFPVLTPLAFDPGHPFPYISNLSLNLAVVVTSKNGEERFARVKVPDVLPRLIEIPNENIENESYRYVWLEDLIASNLELLFPGMIVKESYVFRVTRNADIEIQEDEAEDLISSIEESIRLRKFGSVVRVGVQETMPERIKNILIENLEVTKDDVYPIKQPLGLNHLMSLLKVPRPELKDPPYSPAHQISDEESEDMFGIIQRGDLLLHHPYDSFSPVVQFIKNAASDPEVLAIKQTLYRIGKESPLIPLLIEAAENGKQVAVLVELKARFDEENNIGWAKQLEGAGVHVVYGLVGLKTHGKMALIVRNESDGLRRYVHLGTGNYNPVNARIYTDYSFFSCKEDITNDASEVFNFLTGYSKKESFSKLAVAPITLREKITALIEREVNHARNGKEARLILKINSLTDQKIIEQLYAASKAGVKIDLIIRGICCLRPGITGVSENIRVISIVGRYLEHSRVFWFNNDGSSELFMSSADLMGRNLDRRVELMFPIDDAGLAKQVLQESLEGALHDTAGARLLHADGSYSRIKHGNGEDAFEIQKAIAQSRFRNGQFIKLIPREFPQKN